MQFGEYELLRRLGAGGMAETFIARRIRSGGFAQEVCLKRVLPSHANDDGFTELFLDEARLIARLRNSHIVQVLDFGVVENAYYLALELIEGLDLRALSKALQEDGGGFSADLAVLLAEDMAPRPRLRTQPEKRRSPKWGRASRYIAEQYSPEHFWGDQTR